MRRLVQNCAAVLSVLALAVNAEAQPQRGAPAPPVPPIQVTVPTPTVNITTPPPNVTVTTPQPVVNVTLPSPGDPGQATFGLTPGLGSFFGALTGGLLGLAGVGITAWIGTRNLRRQMVDQAEQTRQQMHEEAVLNREAELRRSDSERRAIAAAFLAEIGSMRRGFHGAQNSTADAQGFVLMPNPKIPIFDAYAGRLHMLNFETVFAVTDAYGTVSYLKSLRVKGADAETLGETLRLHKTQVDGALQFLDRAYASLRAAAGNLDAAADRPGHPARGAASS